MRMINLSLPTPEGDDRTELFFKNLAESSKSFGGHNIKGRWEFFSAKSTSLPNEGGGRIPLGYRTVIALVYETSILDELTEAIRTALSTTWPEIDSFRIYETTTGKQRNLWTIRGGKKKAAP